jgi:hypothetical protein
VLAGLLLTRGPLAVLGIEPSKELIKELAEFTLALGTLLALVLAGGSVWLTLLIGAALARPTPHWVRA